MLMAYKNPFGQDFISKILVVQTETDRFLSNVDLLKSFLTNGEQEVAAQYVHEIRALRYIVHRGILRLLLANILQSSPKSIDIDVTRHGKPFVVRPDHVDIRFSLSHSQNYAMYAFALGREVGIDIEEERLFINPEMAQLVLGKEELEELSTLPVKSHRHAFLRLWTKKEAISKVLGLGLYLDFQELVLGIDRGISPRKKMSYQGMELFDLSGDRFFATIAIDRNGVARRYYA